MENTAGIKVIKGYVMIGKIPFYGFGAGGVFYLLFVGLLAEFFFPICHDESAIGLGVKVWMTRATLKP